MDSELNEILDAFKKGVLSEEETTMKLRALLKADYIERVDSFAQLDVFRSERTGVPEVVYAETKPAGMTLEIVNRLLESKNYAIISRAPPETIDALRVQYEKESTVKFALNSPARLVVITKNEFSFPKNGGKVGIITAGTSDIPVAEEAKIVAEILGCEVSTSYDVGIAGLHRIFLPLKKMLEEGVSAIIVVAGMEGTLPGVVASLADVPVIGVPISSGYGLGAGGVGALTTMLQSCSPGLVVVNIDNGFGAGTSAALIARQSRKK